MKNPELFIKLIDFLLEKRDVARGGVEGFRTPVSFRITDLPDDISSDNLEFMLNTMKNDSVVLSNDDGNTWEEAVIENYRIKGEMVIILKSSTEKLTKFRDRIKKTQKKSLVKINKSKREIIYQRGNKVFSDTNRWGVFLMLYEAFPKEVKFTDIYNRLGKNEHTYRTDEYKMKIVRSMIDCMVIDLKNNHGFPKDIIKPNNNAYKLNY